MGAEGAGQAGGSGGGAARGAGGRGGLLTRNGAERREKLLLGEGAQAVGGDAVRAEEDREGRLREVRGRGGAGESEDVERRAVGEIEAVEPGEITFIDFRI